MTNRTDQIVRAIWGGTEGGTYSIGWPRLIDRLGYTPTPDDIAAVLDTGTVRQIPGGGGPASFRVNITPDDLHAYSVSEDARPDPAVRSDVTIYGAGGA